MHKLASSHCRSWIFLNISPRNLENVPSNSGGIRLFSAIKPSPPPFLYHFSNIIPTIQFAFRDARIRPDSFLPPVEFNRLCCSSSLVVSRNKREEWEEERTKGRLTVRIKGSGCLFHEKRRETWLTGDFHLGRSSDIENPLLFFPSLESRNRKRIEIRSNYTESLIADYSSVNGATWTFFNAFVDQRDFVEFFAKWNPNVSVEEP